MSTLHVYIYIEMLECRTIQHLVSLVREWTKLMMPGQVRYRNKWAQSGIFLVLYRTKTMDVGIQMSALVSSMPVPSYAFRSDNDLSEPSAITFRSSDDSYECGAITTL
jgi:hypothetical protein